MGKLILCIKPISQSVFTEHAPGTVMELTRDYSARFHGLNSEPHCEATVLTTNLLPF